MKKREREDRLILIALAVAEHKRSLRAAVAEGRVEDAARIRATIARLRATFKRLDK